MDGHGTKGFKSPETVEAEMQRALGEGGKPVTHKVDTFALPLIAIQCVLDGESLYSKEPTAVPNCSLEGYRTFLDYRARSAWKTRHLLNEPTTSSTVYEPCSSVFRRHHRA